MTRTRVDLKVLVACGTCCLLLAGCAGPQYFYVPGDTPEYGVIRVREVDAPYDAYCGATDEGPKWIHFGGYAYWRGTSNNRRFLAAATELWESGRGRPYDIVVIDTEAVEEVARWRVWAGFTKGRVAVEEEPAFGRLRAVSVSDDGRLVAMVHGLDRRECGDIEIAVWDTATHRRIRRLRFPLGEAREKVLREYGGVYYVRARAVFSTDKRYITALLRWFRVTVRKPHEFPPMAEDPPALVVTYPLFDK